MSATLVYSTAPLSRRAQAKLGIARVRAAGRVAADRRRAEARAARVRADELATGQHYATDVSDVDFCFVCGRVTDHTGEHSEAQMEAWRSR
jgi:hypothetical protein